MKKKKIISKRGTNERGIMSTNKRRREPRRCIVTAVIDESRDHRMSHPSVQGTAQERARAHAHVHAHTLSCIVIRLLAFQIKIESCSPLLQASQSAEGEVCGGKAFAIFCMPASSGVTRATCHPLIP